MEIDIQIAQKFLAALQGDEKLKEWAITALSRFLSHEATKTKMWPLVEIWLRNYVANVLWYKESFQRIKETLMADCHGCIQDVIKVQVNFLLEYVKLSCYDGVAKSIQDHPYLTPEEQAEMLLFINDNLKKEI